MAIWREVEQLGVELHLVGTLAGRSTEAFRPEMAVPAFGRFHACVPRGLTRPGQLWWLYPGLTRLVRRLRPDVVHVSSEAWGLLAAQALHAGAPTIIHGADNQFWFGNMLESLARTRIARRNLRLAAGYASWNAAGAGLAREYGLPASAPTRVVPFLTPDPDELRFDEGARARVRGALHLARDELVVGFVGRLTAAKGVDLLVEATELMTSTPTLLIAGEGPLRRHLESRAAALGLHTRFLGQVPNSSVREVLSAVDVVAVPSRSTPEWREQFGRSALEAMLVGRATVVSDSGALPEVVSGAGVTFREGDRGALAAALDNALRRRVELGVAARHVASTRFAPRMLATEIVSLWNDATSR